MDGLLSGLTPSDRVLGREVGGFDFSLKHRNDGLVASTPGMRLPKAKKTGTTICGVVYKDGVVLGADTRATEGTTISDKNCEKIHYIAPNIYCCGAGTAADTENITMVISSQLELLRLATRTQSRVVSAMTMLKRRLFQYQGHVSAALVLGGVDVTGPHLYTIYPHGSTDKLPFVTMGSGSLNAMAVLEAGFKDDLSREEAVALVRNAIRAGIFNDLGSGSNVDICVIAKPGADAGAAAAPAGGAGAGAGAESSAAVGGPAAGTAPVAPLPPSALAAGVPSVTYLRNMDKPNEVGPLRAGIVRPASRIIPRGATVVLSEKFEPAAKPLRIPGAMGRPTPVPGLAGAGGAGAGAGGARPAMDVDATA